MLPFIKKDRPIAATTVLTRKSDGSAEPDESNDNNGLEECATDLLRAINSKDTGAIASAIRAAFEILDSQPHKEGEHLNEE